MLPTNVTQARDAATQYTQQANATGAAEPLIADVLRQKITEAYASSQDIVKPLDVATQNYLASPAAGREKYQDIFNPFQRENLVAQYSGNQAIPMLGLSSILGQRFGSMADTVNAGANAFKSQAVADQGRVTLANNLYSSLLDEYVKSEAIKSQQEQDKLARDKFAYDKAKDGSGGTGGLLSALQALGIVPSGTGTGTGTDTRLPLDLAIEEDQQATQTPAQSWTPAQGWPSPFTVLGGLAQNKPTPVVQPTYPQQSWPKIPGY